MNWRRLALSPEWVFFCGCAFELGLVAKRGLCAKGILRDVPLWLLPLLWESRVENMVSLEWEGIWEGSL